MYLYLIRNIKENFNSWICRSWVSKKDWRKNIWDWKVTTCNKWFVGKYSIKKQRNSELSKEINEMQRWIIRFWGKSGVNIWERKETCGGSKHFEGLIKWQRPCY